MRAQIVLENVGVHLPNRVLFEKVNWTLYEGTKLALAGRNGSGKSTLLRIMAGRGESTDGRCTVVGKRDLKIGYLDQSLLDSAVLETKALKDQSLSAVSFLQHRLAQSVPDDTFEDHQWKIRKMLSGLGFSAELMDAPMNRLSGGWLLRMFIAGTLLDEPDVLLLDEPTNHLDLSSIQWLEEFLAEEYQGSLVLITHDVALQKRTTNALAVLHGGNFYVRTDQNDYLTFRDSLEVDRVHLEKNIETLDKKIDDLQEFVDKYRAKARIATRAQSKARTIEDLDAERQILRDKLARIEGFHYNLKFRFRMGAPGGKFPLVVKGLDFRYKDTDPYILKNVTMDVARGQRVALVGDNGAGKTTFLNLLGKRLNPSAGEVQFGHGVEIGYFGQHQLDELNLDETVLENLRVKAPAVSVEQCRRWLGAFGFHGDDEIGKKAKVLSGGERARLALLRILVTPVNVCLLDEPTNHLDIETKELLKDAIRNFEGTVVIVSHDREFVSALADRVLYLTTDHKLTDHIGTLDSFFEKYPQYVRHIEGHVEPSKAPVLKADLPAKPKGPTLSFEERKKVKNRLKSVERLLGEAESDIEKYGEEKGRLERQSLEPGFYEGTPEADRQRTLARISELEGLLRARMAVWEKLGLELEQLRTLFEG